MLFGVQKGRGSAYETIQKQTSQKATDLVFEFAVQVKDGRAADFAGPFVQGPPDGRFVYIDIGTATGQIAAGYSRRLKVPLGGITKEMIDSGAVLEMRTPGTGKDGGPSCATVKSVTWKSQRR